MITSHTSFWILIELCRYILTVSMIIPVCHGKYQLPSSLVGISLKQGIDQNRSHAQITCVPHTASHTDFPQHTRIINEKNSFQSLKIKMMINTCHHREYFIYTVFSARHREYFFNPGVRRNLSYILLACNIILVALYIWVLLSKQFIDFDLYNTIHLIDLIQWIL